MKLPLTLAQPRLRAGLSGFRIPAEKKTSSLPPKRPNPFWGSRWPPINVYPGCAEGVDRPTLDVGGSPPSSVEVRN